MIDFKHIADAALSRGIFCCHIAEPTNTIRSDTLLPVELKQQYPDIPWKEISGFRNIRGHHYLGDIDAKNYCRGGRTSSAPPGKLRQSYA
ncbi:MAG: hypothetical protein KIS65_03390 [Nitrosomonas sp.]|nr:hypothetical protein [Nitrosomonas sp.]